MTDSGISQEEILRRLEEAEETIRAIRSGDIDALLIRDTSQEKLFTVHGEGETYRKFMDALNIGAVATDMSGVLLYANQQFYALCGRKDGMIGERLQEQFSEEANECLVVLLASQGQRHSCEVKMAGDDGAMRTYQVSASPLMLGLVNGLAVTFTDISDRVRAELSERSEQIALGIIRSANEAVFVCDRDRVVTHANSVAIGLSGLSPVGKDFEEALALRLRDSVGRSVSSVIDDVGSGSEFRGLDVVFAGDDGAREFLFSAAPLHLDGVTLGSVITMIEVTSRNLMERQLRLVVRELDHRVKNTLALVTSISQRTLMHEDTMAGFHSAFTERIQALAATHDLLAANTWAALPLSTVLIAELAPFQHKPGERISISGLDIMVSARAAIAFGLVIHELATNAAKYGALSRSNGKVNVSVVGRTPTGELKIVWRESDGPPVEPPKRRGFGYTVITRSLTYAGDGGADIHYERDGVVCELRLPAMDLQ